MVPLKSKWHLITDGCVFFSPRDTSSRIVMFPESLWAHHQRAGWQAVGVAGAVVTTVLRHERGTWMARKYINNCHEEFILWNIKIDLHHTIGSQRDICSQLRDIYNYLEISLIQFEISLIKFEIFLIVLKIFLDNPNSIYLWLHLKISLIVFRDLSDCFQRYRWFEVKLSLIVLIRIIDIFPWGTDIHI